MMNRLGINIEVTVLTVVLLGKVQENRKTHMAIVAEAKAGYVKKAEAALRERLEKISAGEILPLKFSLVPPEDHTKAYDTIIGMLAHHTEETIKLDADQYRHLVADEWEWSDTFFTTNMLYSESASRVGASR